MSIDEQAQDIVSLVEQMNLTHSDVKLHIVGHDWGSSAVQSAVKLRSDLFISTTLVSYPETGLITDAYYENPIQLFLSWHVFMFHYPVLPEWWFVFANGFVWFYNKTSGFEILYNHERVKAVEKYMRKPGVLTAALGWYRSNYWQTGLAMTGLFGQERREAVLEQFKLIQIPTLTIVGKYSGSIHPNSIREDSEQTSINKQLVIVEKAGHFVHHDQPSEFNTILESWLIKT